MRLSVRRTYLPGRKPNAATSQPPLATHVQLCIAKSAIGRLRARSAA